MSGPRPRTTALCNTCGTPRPCAWYEFDQRRLRCDTCDTNTVHSLIAPAGAADWREHQNRRASGPLSEVAKLEAFLTSMGIYVWDHSGAQGGTVEVRRYLEPLAVGKGVNVSWVVGINPELTPAARVDALRWAWRYMLPDESWDRCQPLGHGKNRHVGVHRLPAGAR